MRPKLKAVVIPDCDKSMKSCDKCENFDAARRTQSCQAHERYSDAEVIAALVAALKELGVTFPLYASQLPKPKE